MLLEGTVFVDVADVEIGGEDLVEALFAAGLQGEDVSVILMAEPPVSGALTVYEGFHGTDVTPAEPPEVWVGDVNLLEKLQGLDGRFVALSVVAV